MSTLHQPIGRAPPSITWSYGTVMSPPLGYPPPHRLTPLPLGWTTHRLTPSLAGGPLGGGPARRRQWRHVHDSIRPSRLRRARPTNTISLCNSLPAWCSNIQCCTHSSSFKSGLSRTQCSSSINWRSSCWCCSCSIFIAVLCINWN